jgi:penicillin-binding protein 1A
MRRNGEVVAMIGGADYAASPFNRATQSRRQPGSTFKLFVYLAAIRKGWKPEDTIDNGEMTRGTYRPRNAGGRYSKSITLADAFARSSNVAAVRLFKAVGDDAVIATARDLGVTSPMPRDDPSLPLGTSSMTLLELTAAYAGVAANSFPVAPTAFKAEKADWFDHFFDGRDSLSSREHEDIERLLARAVDQGTGRAARLGRSTFGKTGTSQDNRDALFVGYAGDLVVGVWVGNDDNSPLKGVSGGGLPARIWRDFMRQALRERSVPQKRADPTGPVQPLDIPDLRDIPLGQDSRLRIENGQAVISTEVGGAPVDLRIGGGGVEIGGDAAKAQLDRARESLKSLEERARKAGQRLDQAERRQGDPGNRP